MSRYKVYCERLNFGFHPALKQTADVVFDTDVPCDDDHIEMWEKELWKAIWEQNPHWLNPKGPVAGAAGWSSVFPFRDKPEKSGE